MWKRLLATDGLVELVLSGRGEVTEVATVQAVHKQGHTLNVEHRVGPRDRWLEKGPHGMRLVVPQPESHGGTRNKNDKTHPVGDWKAAAHHAGAWLLNVVAELHPAINGGSNVVRVSLDF